MSDTSDDKPESGIRDIVPENQWPFPKNRDWLLARIVDLTQFGLGIPATITVRGSLLSGEIISGEQYLEEMALNAEKITSDAGDGVISNAFANLFRTYKPIYQRPENAAEGFTLPPPNYIHMKNAFWFQSAGRIPTGSVGLLWRGRMSEVDGFTLGGLVQG